MSVLDSTTEESEFEMDPLDYQKEDLLDDVRFKLSTLNQILKVSPIHLQFQYEFNVSTLIHLVANSCPKGNAAQRVGSPKRTRRGRR